MKDRAREVANGIINVEVPKNFKFPKPTYTGKPIILQRLSFDAYLEPGEPVVLHPNGNVQCGKVIWKPSGLNLSNFRRAYAFIRENLPTKFGDDASSFRDRHPNGYIAELKRKGQKTVSVEKLWREILVWNDIGFFVQRIYGRFVGHAARKWRTEQNRLYRAGKDVEATANRDALERKRQQANRLLNAQFRS